MKWYYVSAITLAVYWTIGVIIAAFNKAEPLELWAVGLIYPIAYVLFYPVRAWMAYSKSCHYYEKHGISRWQYMFGKRVTLDDDD